MAKSKKSIRRDIEQMLSVMFNALDGKEQMGKCFNCEVLIPTDLPDCFNCVPPNCTDKQWHKYQTDKLAFMKTHKGEHTIKLSENEEIDFSASIANMEEDDFFTLEEQQQCDEMANQPNRFDPPQDSEVPYGEFSIYSVDYVKGLEGEVAILQQIITEGDNRNEIN